MNGTPIKVTTQEKTQIIKRVDNGEDKKVLAKEYNISVYLINTIIKSPKRDKILLDAIKDTDPELYKKRLIAYKQMYGGW